MPPPDRGAPPGHHAAARGARRRARRHRLRAVRRGLLPPLVPAGAHGRGLRLAGAREPRAQDQDRGAARQHRRPQRADAGQDARRARRPDHAGVAARRRAARRPSATGRAAAAAEARRLAAARELASLRGAPARRRAPLARRPSSASAAGCCAPANRAAPVPVGPIPAGRAGAAQPLPAARHGHPAPPAGDPPRGHRGHRRGAVLQRDDQDRRRQGRVLLPARAPRGVPRRRGGEALPARLPVPGARRPAVRHAARDLARRAQAARATAASRPARASARTGSRRPTTATCAGWTATRAWSSTRSATATTRARPRQRRPIQGQQLRLTLDLGLQRAANDAMARAIAAANLHGQRRQGGRLRGDGPDERRGARARLLSELRREPVRQADLPGASFDALNSEANGAPLFNRAIAATYPTGSTFKPITAHGGARERDHRHGLDHHRHRLLPARQPACCRTRAAPPTGRSPSRRRSRSRRTSSSTRSASGRTRCPARSSRRGPSGSGSAGRPASTSPASPTASCRTPSGATRATRSTRSARSATSVEERTSAALFACGGIERPWSTGDNVNLAIGQGDLQATPLQMAVAYSTIVNGGRVVRPHLGWKIEDGLGPPDRGDHQAARGARSSFSALEPAGDHGGPARRGDGGGRHLGLGDGRLPAHRVRQDGHGRARRPARPVVVRRLRPAPDAPDRRRGDGRARRLRRGDRRARRAAHPVGVVRRRRQGGFVAGRAPDR